MGIGDEMSDAWKRGDWRGALAKGAARMKQVALDMTDLEVKTEEATNNDKWGPHGSLGSTGPRRSPSNLALFWWFCARIGG